MTTETLVAILRPAFFPLVVAILATFSLNLPISLSWEVLVSRDFRTASRSCLTSSRIPPSEVRMCGSSERACSALSILPWCSVTRLQGGCFSSGMKTRLACLDANGKKTRAIDSIHTKREISLEDLSRETFSRVCHRSLEGSLGECRFDVSSRPLPIAKEQNGSQHGSCTQPKNMEKQMDNPVEFKSEIDSISEALRKTIKSSVDILSRLGVLSSMIKKDEEEEQIPDTERAPQKKTKKPIRVVCTKCNNFWVRRSKHVPEGASVAYVDCCRNCAPKKQAKDAKREKKFFDVSGIQVG